MKLICYESSNGNFGDDLNHWLWPKIFPKGTFDNDEDDTAFLGIGSILSENNPFLNEANTYKYKCIAGSGVRSLNENIQLDSSWDLSFFRGPFSSYKITGDFNNYISDSAYFYTLLKEYKSKKNSPKKYKISIIPYFKSLDTFDWHAFCRNNNYNLILPTGRDTEHFIQEIASSETVICEAMHGAIMADILRVPWKRLKYRAHQYESELVSEFKWHDWYASIKLHQVDSIHFEMKTENLKHKLLRKKYQRRAEKNLNDAINKINHFDLSDDTVFNEIVEKLKNKQKYLSKKYGNTITN